jgi:hypothetical protein
MTYYTYKLIDSTTGETFYIGKGAKSRMYQHKRDALNDNYNHRSVHRKIQSILNKGGDISYEKFLCETEQDAFDLEIKLIAEHGRKDMGTGLLCNLTEGGEGASGVSPEAIEKRAESNRGKKRSNKSRKYMSQIQLEMANKLREERGYVRTPEARAKQSAATKGTTWSEASRAVVRNKPTAKPVIAHLKDSNEVVGEYESVSLAAKELGCDTTTVWRICEGTPCMRGGKKGKLYPLRSHKGYTFKYT